MPNFLDNLKLRGLLRVTATLLKRAEARSCRFRQMLGEDAFVFQIATDAGTGGHFVLDNGRIRYHGGVHPRPDFAQVWRRSGDAVRVLTSPDEAELLRAFDEGLCRMQGRFTVALWFNEAMKIARAKGSDHP
jgi:hypothetical protein